MDQLSMVSLTKRTAPLPSRMFAPPGCEEEVDWTGSVVTFSRMDRSQRRKYPFGGIRAYSNVVPPYEPVHWPIDSTRAALIFPRARSLMKAVDESPSVMLASVILELSVKHPLI